MFNIEFVLSSTDVNGVTTNTTLPQAPCTNSFMPGAFNDAKLFQLKSQLVCPDLSNLELNGKALGSNPTSQLTFKITKCLSGSTCKEQAKVESFVANLTYIIITSNTNYNFQSTDFAEEPYIAVSPLISYSNSYPSSLTITLNQLKVRLPSGEEFTYYNTAGLKILQTYSEVSL